MTEFLSLGEKNPLIIKEGCMDSQKIKTQGKHKEK